jgi:hypothetical protein
LTRLNDERVTGRSPSGTYLLYAEFETDAGSNALYYDVSRWAAYQNALTY